MGDRNSELGQALAIQQALVPAAVTDVGCEREINEDRYAVVDGAAGRLWLVCDGMGGVLGGELAAQLAIDTIRRSLEVNRVEDAVEALRAAIDEANRVIVLRRQNPAFSAMGTTVVGAYITPRDVVIGHAGDSRAYLVRDGSVQQLTTDHTYVQSLVERGLITHEEALSHPQAHVLTRCIGSEPRLKVDVQRLWIWPVEAGAESDKLVLCSDGLYGLLSDKEIGEIITSQPPQEACIELVEQAKKRGGYDNITVAVVPLNGRLYDKRPEGADGVSKAARKAKRRPAPAPKARKPLPLGVKFVLSVGTILMAIGIVFLGVLLSLMDSTQ